jgi:hypothetical protein
MFLSSRSLAGNNPLKSVNDKPVLKNCYSTHAESVSTLGIVFGLMHAFASSSSIVTNMGLAYRLNSTGMVNN